jgi:hypothetical protein
MSPARTRITGIRAVSIPAGNQDDALRSCTGTPGFTTLRDTPTPAGGRFIELAPGHASVIITLEAAAPDVICAPAHDIFQVLASPVRHPEFDGSESLRGALRHQGG